jgi:hypothetical protein
MKVYENTCFSGAIWRTTQRTPSVAGGSVYNATIKDDSDVAGIPPFISNNLFPIVAGTPPAGGPAGLGVAGQFDAGCAIYKGKATTASPVDSKIDANTASSEGFQPGLSNTGNVYSPCSGNCYCPTPPLVKRTVTRFCRNDTTKEILVSGER